MDLPARYWVTVDREPALQDRRALVVALGAYNDPFLPNTLAHTLAVLLRAPDDQLRAGLDGFT